MYTDLIKNGRVKKGKKNENKGLSNKTVLQAHRILRKALNHANKMQLINVNSADMVEPPKAAKFEAKYIKTEQVSDFLKSFEDTDLYIPVLLGVGLGLRRGEILGLRWQDINFNEKTLSVNQTLVRVGKVNTFSTPKTDKSKRVLVVSDKIIDCLKKRKAEVSENKLFMGEAYEDFDLIVCKIDGTPFSPNSIGHKYRYIIKKKKLPVIRFHDLRHTNATLMLKNKISPKVASERLGHSNISTTMDLYSHVDREMQKEVADKINSVL